ncbi:ATP-binding protein [Cereibacter azotoformans]|uniref:IstB-like ATP-binding domain-containing protein n=1 Tax=Cereibacter sphaeroides (strain ATCC 17025 / ATH 2.4.3) TaxID=349102 RepID=A4WYA9_CERS5|nr:ATP-binding protein [Cereibacter azotoformans]
MLPDLPDHLDRMLTRLKLTAIRDQLDSLLDEAGRRELTICEALTMLCEREIARKDQRRIEMSFGLARFPFHRDLAGFDFAAQPSIDRGQIRDLATGRFIANGEAVLLLGPPGVGKTQVSIASRVRCHGEVAEAYGFAEVIADRTRFPARREPGQGVAVNQAGSGRRP